MLQDEKTVRIKDPGSYHQIWQCLDVFHIIRRIGKNQVVLTEWVLQELENIFTDGFEIFCLHNPGCFIDEFNTVRIAVDGGDQGSSPGKKLVRNASGSGKEIEHPKSLKIHKVGQDIKKAFLGEIGSGPHSHASWRMDLLPPEFSCNDPHNTGFSNE